jgi:hypothetical protein
MEVESHRGHQVATFFKCKDASKNNKFLEKRKESSSYLRCTPKSSPSVQTHDSGFGVARCPRNQANAVANISDAFANLVNRTLVQLRQQLNIVEDRVRGGQGAREEKTGSTGRGFSKKGGKESNPRTESKKTKRKKKSPKGNRAKDEKVKKEKRR